MLFLVPQNTLRIPLGILSLNIKMFLQPFDSREVLLNNLIPETTRDREKSVCQSGYLLITTEGLLLPVF